METSSNPIIADTSALVSLIIPSDVNHAEAVKEATRLLSADRFIVLPSEVLAETLNLLGKKFGHGFAVAAARKFLRSDSQYLIVETDIERLRTALVISNKQKESVSFTDCIVMAVAEQYDTQDIFGFDEQFEDAGYKRLAPAGKEAA
jgi:predicted nucleic acid-binding protein